jgi:hypothetical protein
LDIEGFRIVALAAPGSVEAALGKLQAELFSRYGLASAQAMPPLIPVAFLPLEAPTRGLLGSLNDSVRAPWSIRTTGCEWAGEYLYVDVESGGAWAALRARTLERCGAEPDGLFPVREGFFMGCGDAAPAQRDTIRPAIAPAAFSSSDLVLVSIERLLGQVAWWRELYWEIVEQRPLRGRREK